jgi:hypothetical protein
MLLKGKTDVAKISLRQWESEGVGMLGVVGDRLFK